MTESDKSTTTNSEFAKKAAARVEPILKHLDTEDIIIEKEKISELFVELWEYEDGENLKPETQRLTTIALFIYTTHNILDNYNIRINSARTYIIEALRAWMKPELEKAVAAEKASDDPFKAFLESNQPDRDQYRL